MSTPDTSHLDFTDWHCETCGHRGRIQYVKGASVYEVIHILEDAHRDASKGACTDLAKVRVTHVETPDKPHETPSSGTPDTPSQNANLSGAGRSGETTA